jgi:ferric-dicitrate binding protein FerR (iron transport regulator)
VRSICRSILLAALVSGMLNSSLLAAAKPLGMVVVAQNAHLGEADLALGTNVFSGDFLQTEPRGNLRLRLGSAQVYLNAASAAILDQQGESVGAKLVRGTVGFSSAPANGFQIETPVATVRPAKGTAFGEVTIVNPQTILVAAYRGSLLVTGNGIERVIPEGSAYNVSLAPDPEPAPASPSPQGAYGVSNHAHIIFAAVILGAAGLGGYLAWHYTTESDPNPTPQ